MKQINKENIKEILKECYDPEIPIDLWNLGLIYNISIGDNDIDITMSLTTPGCTMGQYMADDIKFKLIEKLKNVKNVNVEVVFDPLWQPEMMTDEGRKKLGFSPSNESDNTDKEWE